ncbi:30S ribosomal protein S9 [Candidatus Pacearchaeota archaeon]|jgi:small subunit ribosomal protein S9|nr:30S ribosomal protein S9 [Candidatus Pacearchaeota archaeon]
MTLKIISGKRKSAVAKLRLVDGSGQITFNRLPVEELNLFHKLALLEPMKIYQRELGDALKHDFQINTKGGGAEGQIQAARLAIAKALVHVSGSDTLKKAFMTYDRNMIVPDVRRKEAYKPGDSKARSKRQKSYR